ncbi:MAG: ABC transporter ATP-binding protein [Sphaerochaetaceae bacterium]|nr:ABC transporter ATP-binding protein/permease [Spirochaetaceae bacterium]MDY6344408.1 ABC transporter ATP-binding protein [Sphaerochaetaceae bacterium]
MPQMRFGQKAKNPKATGSRLFKLVVGKHKLAFTVVLTAIAVSALCSVRLSLFLQELIDGYILPMLQSGTHDFTALKLALTHLAWILMAGTVAGYLVQRLMVGISMDTLRDIRSEMFHHMEKLPLAFFDTHAHGKLMSTFTNDTDTLQMMITQSITQIITSILTITFVLASMLVLSWVLTIVVLLFIALIFWLTKKLGDTSSVNYKGQQKELATINGFIEEMIGGQRVVKVFNHEEASKQSFDQMNEDLRRNADKANSLANVMGPVTNNVGNLQYVAVTIIGAAMALIPGMHFTIGSLAAFLQLTRSIHNPIGQVAQQMNNVLLALAGAERIFSLLDEKPEEDDGYVTLVNANVAADGTITESKEHTGQWAWKHPHKADGSVTYTPLKGDIQLEHVTFGYTPDKLVLHDITLYAKPGQKIAFVGATGAGKTTITNLLNRFYDIQEGKIRFDGINIQKIKKSDLRRSLGMVLQDTHLFSGTIAENIRFGKPDATDEEVIQAAKLAGAHEFILMHPQGYQTRLAGDGEGLSQGQRQLLSIARAAVNNPPVMVLDEATSSIDTYTESIVQQGMDRLMAGRTVFVIAHRLSTVQNSQAIMVLDHGRIIERGTHEDLLRQKGVYWQLYTGSTELS